MADASGSLLLFSQFTSKIDMNILHNIPAGDPRVQQRGKGHLQGKSCFIYNTSVTNELAYLSIMCLRLCHLNLLGSDHSTVQPPPRVTLFTPFIVRFRILARRYGRM